MIANIIPLPNRRGIEKIINEILVAAGEYSFHANDIVHTQIRVPVVDWLVVTCVT